MNIVVIGSINSDSVLKVKELPKKGETIMATSLHMKAGGKGANQAVAAKRLGVDVYMIGAIGKDAAGEELLIRLKNEGINTDGVKISDKPTGCALITVEDSGSNTVVVYSGSNGDLDTEWIKKNIDIIKLAEFIILQMEIPIETVEFAIKLAKQYNKRLILNPAPAREISHDIYKSIDIITPNETELEKLTGTSDIKEGASRLLERGIKHVVVTLGSNGCFYMGESEKNGIWVKSVKVEAIDSTAAGDAFNAALAVALSEGKSIEEALRYANVVGALTTTKIGAQDSLPFSSDVYAMISKLNAAWISNEI